MKLKACLGALLIDDSPIAKKVNAINCNIVRKMLVLCITLINTKIGSECGNKLIRKFRANHVRRIGDAESNIDLFRRQMINGEMEVGYYMAQNDEKMRKSKKVKRLMKNVCSVERVKKYLIQIFI